jgi:hypothetical protein
MKGESFGVVTWVFFLKKLIINSFVILEKIIGQQNIKRGMQKS